MLLLQLYEGATDVYEELGTTRLLTAIGLGTMPLQQVGSEHMIEQDCWALLAIDAYVIFGTFKIVPVSRVRI